MDNLKTHSEHADQPHGSQANALSSFALPTSQILDSHMTGQLHTNLSAFWFSLEQHRLQLGQALQLHNEQLQVSMQQQISMQNVTLLNLLESVTRDALMQKHGEIASLLIELQKKQQDLETTLHDRDEWMKVAMDAYEINQTLIHMLRPAEPEVNSHVSSNGSNNAPSCYRGEASSVARTAVETTQPKLVCRLCNFGNACMLLLPCQHLCACKPCVACLASCPICGVVKTHAIEARFD